ncbi:MAG: TonB-dependent receptor [Prevotella sp.]|nr:TonB-dependent receptor [Prevotella sp.]
MNNSKTHMKILCLLAIGLICSSVGNIYAYSLKSDGVVEQQQARVTVQGKVIDSQGEPLVGVSVTIKGTTNGTMTDIDGAYSIATTSDATLVFTYIGYKAQSIAVGNQTNISITMEEDAQMMDEVIVVGYGVMKKSDVTGAISSVKSDAISRQPVANVAQALQGQVPGVIVTSNSGAPGGSINVRIRGIGTVNNSDPLYVVDGMPVSNIDYLSTSDIQSMEILKDASATAIYGARGANGVVLITTKQGKAGKTTVTLDAYYGASKVVNKLDLLDGPQWYDLQTEINKVRGSAPIDLSKVDRNTSTDWMKEITRTAAIQSYNLGISGGMVDEYTYNLGVGYIDQEGTIKKTDYQRLSFRQNIEKTIIKKTLVLGTNLNISQSRTNKILEGSNTVGIVNSAIKLEPVIPVRDEDGNYGFSPYVDYNNPVADIDFTNNKSKTTSIVGNIYADLNFLKYFKFKSSFGVDMRKTDDYIFNPTYEVSSYQKNPVNMVTRGYLKSDYFVWENTLNYTRTFAEKHSVNALVGYTREWGRTETLEGSKKNTPNNDFDLQYLDAAQDGSSATAVGTAYESALISYLGRINYDFDDRYLFTASIRRDGSSRFGSDHQYGNFPSFALGWKVSNEDFFKNLNAGWVSSLKLRAGWGRIGNQNIDNYMYQNLLSSNIQYSYLFGNGSAQQLYQGLVAVKMGNANVKWETTESTNIGLDANFLSGRLTFSGEYYYKKTKDMLITEPIPNYLGFETGPMTNIGSAENKGFEFNIDWRDQIGDFSYNVGFNISTIKHKMLSIGSGSPITGGALRNGNATLTRVGDPIGAFYGYKTNGLVQTEAQLTEVRKLQPNAQLGDVVFVNTNGDESLNDQDKVVIGNPIPDFIYGINLGFGYKGFDLNMQWGGTYGNDIFNAMRYYTYDLSSVTNKDVAVLNYWRPDNTNTNIPRLAGSDVNDNMRISDRYVEDGSYLRLRNIQLGYTFPVSFSKKAYMQKLRIYVTGQNLFTFTDYSGADPEVGQITSTNYLSRGVDIGTYPQAMTITGGVSITF